MIATSTILIVDDQEPVRIALGELLEDEGYNLAFASNGSEALSRSAELTPDLILLDIIMPDIDGFEICGRLRADPLLAEVPIIMVTTLADSESRLRGIQAGADDFISRPFDPFELRARVRTTTRLNRYRRLLVERTERQHAEHERDAALEALVTSEERYRSLFDNVPLGLYRRTPDGRFLDANPALVKMLSYPDRASLLASNVRMGSDDPTDCARWQALVEQEGTVRGFEIQWYRHDGTAIWVQETARAIRNAEGQVLYYEGAVEDVTCRKQAHQALQESRAHLEHSNRLLADRVAELETLNRIATAMSSQLETKALLQFIVESGADLVHAASCSILLIDPETEELVFQAAVDHVVGLRVPPNQGIAARALRERTPQMIHDVAADPEHFMGIDRASNVALCSLLAIPLLIGDKAIGVLSAINKRQGQFDEQDQTILEALASHAAIAIENARLNEQAKQEIAQRRDAERTLEELNGTLEERVRQRTFDLQVLHDFSREIGKIRNADLFVHLILANLHRAMSYDVAASILVTRELTGLFVQPTRPLTAAVQQEIQERMAKSLTLLSGKEIVPEQSCFPTQTLAFDRFDGTQPAVMKLGSAFQVPLVLSQEEGVVGLLFVGAEREQAFTEDQMRLIFTIANQASLFLSVRRSEEQVLAALQEKEVLLKEIHHRVKNNLQVVSSLLKLQSESIEDPDTLAVFRESQHRVKSMALVHERLYRSKDLSRIDFGDYIRSLAEDLFRSYNAHRSRITLKVDVNDAVLDVDRATPCGLIVNELISNALKYAFPTGQPGQVYVGLFPGNTEYVLVVRDNGVGLPQDLNWKQAQSLGLKLVHTLVRQLKGRVTVRSEAGTEFEIAFPVPGDAQKG